MFLLYPSTTFRQVQEDGELVQENPPGTNLVFFKIDPTVGVPSTFGFDNFNFQGEGCGRLVRLQWFCPSFFLTHRT